MTSRQTDELSMQKVVEKLWANTTPSILGLFPEIDTINGQYKTNIDLLDNFYNGQNTNRTGTALSKEEIRTVMSQQAYTIAAKTCAYAIAIDDEELQMKVTYTYSSFVELRQAVVANTCQEIFDIARDLVTELTPYGVSEASLNELRESIRQFRAIQPKTREGIVDKKLFTSQIADLFEENRKLLFRMDQLVEMVRFEQPLFYEQFNSSRRIIDTGGRKLSLRGNITDELGQPIKDVKITVETKKPVSATSTDKGNYQFKGIPGGVWAVTYSKLGYKDLKEFLAFTPNQRVDFSPVLQQEVQKQAVS